MSLEIQHGDTCTNLGCLLPLPYVRVALWCCQRSLSTLFERCIAAGGGVEVFHEVYLAAFRYGPQHARESRNYEIDDDFTFENVSTMLRSSYRTKEAVFLKDMAYAVEGRFAEIPSTFHHTFLIRSPAKVVRSYLKLLNRCAFDDGYCTELRHKLPNSFRQQCALYDFFSASEDKRPLLVIDADDFATSPETILKRYCHETKITFRETMLKWESRQTIPEEWHASEILRKHTQQAGSYERALSSTGVQAPSCQADTLEDLLPDDWLQCVNECQPFYDRLYAKRMCIP
ncbi:uncharacterized protein [Diadema setosum]|uniref:uncharacterized protein n=1 Tax=Diadema setosum TaxID=31175 RepID=UPI003B3AF138